MSRVVLARAGGLELELEEPVIPGDALPAVGSAIETLHRLEALRGELIRRGRRRFVEARDEGLAEGREQGRLEAEARLAAAIAGIEAALRADRVAREARVVGLALAVVERIAGDLGDATVVEALARRALADLDPDRPVRLRVHPSVAAAVADAPATLVGPRVLEVLGDPVLGPLDCEIDGDDGVVEAGLGVQLDAVRRALSAAAHGETA